VQALPTTKGEQVYGDECNSIPKPENPFMAVTTDFPIPRPAVGRRRRRFDLAGIGLWSYTGLVFAFLFAPILIIFLTSFTASRAVEFPPQGFSLIWYGKFLDALRDAPGLHPGLARSIWFSVNLGVVTAFVSTVGGVLAAYALHKFVFGGKEVFQNLFMLPLTFPSLVIGVALLLTFSEYRLFDRFTRLLIGHVVVTLPFVILSVGASLRVYEEDIEEAARSLGANAAQILWHITLPLIRPGILAGAIFAFITSFTNFTVSFFLSVNAAKPVPIWIYELILNGNDPILAALSVFLIALAIGVLIVIERLIGIRRIVGT
jgi:putative spermidine/putrescine transport system permease protein